MVINYDLPTDGVTYMHRIGRCGRAGRLGLVVPLFTEANFGHLRGITNGMKLSGCDVPDWMLSLKNGSYSTGGRARRIRNDGKMPTKRQGDNETQNYDRVKTGKRKTNRAT